MCFHGLFFSALLCVFCPSPFTEKRSRQPSPVGVVFRGHHERAGWFSGEAVRAMDRNAEQKKHGLKTWTVRCRSRASQPTLFYQSSTASELFPGEDPLGMEGVEHWGWASSFADSYGGQGGFGEADPALLDFRRSCSVGVKDACELARQLPRDEGRSVPSGDEESSCRDSEAAGWDTRRSYISMNRAVGRGVARGDGGDPFAEGHAPAGNGKWGGFEYNCSCVLSGKHSFMPTEPGSQRSYCRVCWFLRRCSQHGRSELKRQSDRFPRSEESRAVCRAVRWASRGSAKPTALTLRWWSEADGWPAVGAWAAEISRARSPTGECQTNLIFPVRSATFPGGETERQRSVATGKMGVLTAIAGVLPGRSLAGYCWSWPDEVSRPIARPRRQAEPRAVLRCLARAKHRGLLLVLAGRSLAAILLVLADMRSIAASGFLNFGARTSCS